MKDSTEMSGEGPSDELQEVEEELVSKKGEGNEADDEDIEAVTEKKEEIPSWYSKLGVEQFKVFSQVSPIFVLC